MDRIWISVLTSLGAACGTVSNQSTDARAADAPPQAACDPSKPFGAPIKANSVDTVHNEWGARLSLDQLTIYVGSDSPGNNQLFEATRSTTQDAFGAPFALTSLNDPSAQTGGPSVTADQLTIYFHSGGRPGAVGSDDLYTSTRTSTAAAFPAPSLTVGINSTSDDEYPYVLPDGATLYFNSNRDSSGDIFVATRSSSGVFGTPTAVAAVNTNDDEATPVVTSDQLTIFFGRHPRGGDNADIYVAHRTTLADGFGTPAALTELNTAGAEYPQWVSPDGCTLYFISNGQPGSSGMDVFEATRLK